MKQVLSKDQVNANLAELAKSKGKESVNISCFKIEYSHYNNQPYFHFTSKDENWYLVAFGKKVFHHSVKDDNYSGRGMQTIIDGKEFTPWIYKDQCEMLLTCCGLKEPKKIKPVTPEQRLRQLDLQNLIPIYKMMLSVDLISADLETKYRKDYWGNEKTHEPFMALVVRHTKGSFSLPIDNYPEEIQNIFFNALNLPVTSKLKTA